MSLYQVKGMSSFFIPAVLMNVSKYIHQNLWYTSVFFLQIFYKIVNQCLRTVVLLNIYYQIIEYEQQYACKAKTSKTMNLFNVLQLYIIQFNAFCIQNTIAAQDVGKILKSQKRLIMFKDASSKKTTISSCEAKIFHIFF